MADYKKHLTPEQYEVCWDKGTEPTGLRYYINSLSLSLDEGNTNEQ